VNNKTCFKPRDLAIAAMFAAAAQPALAQSTGADEGSRGLEEIVVTAQKRSQSEQDVPIAISAFTARDMQNLGIKTTQDLQRVTPGFVLSSNVHFAQPYIRGIGNSTLTIGSDSSVATIVDGVYLTRPVAAFQQFLDIERVEILKGPQGTLYGRNATGGVINVVSEPPSPQPSGRAEVSVGDYDLFRVAATVSGPIAGEAVRGRVSVLTSSHDGYVKDIGTGSELENEQVFAGKFAVVADLNASTTLTTAGDFSRERDARGQGLKILVPGAGSVGAVFPADPRTVDYSFRPFTNVDEEGIRVQLDHSEDSWALTSISAYRYSRFDVGIDLDASSRSYSTVDPESESSRAFTQEVRFSSRGDQRFNYVVGGYFLKERAETQFNIHLLTAGIVSAPNGFTDVTAYAGFADVSYRLTDQFLVSAGGRYSTEQKDARVVTNFPPPTVTDTGTDSWNAFTPRFVLQYFLAKDIMLFASASKGFKSGGFDVLTRGAPRFDPEYIWAYEGGVKSEWLDHRLQANLSAFTYNYSNLQVAQIQPGSVIQSITNAASAKIKGSELSLRAAPTPWLSLDSGLSYLDAKFGTYLTVDTQATPPGPVDLAGRRLPRAPKLQGFLGATISAEAGSLGRFDFAPNATYQSQMFFDQFNQAITSQSGYALFNASLAWIPHEAHWKLTAYGRNLGNRLYATNGGQSTGQYGTVVWWGDPRTFGLTGTMDF
jgi:iron complex outermembrane recepter protein